MIGKRRDYVSQVEAARLRGVSKQAIADLIAWGRLKAVLVAGRKLVLRSDVQSLIARPRLGRPPKKRASEAKSKKRSVRDLKLRAGGNGIVETSIEADLRSAALAPSFVLNVQVPERLLGIVG